MCSFSIIYFHGYLVLCGVHMLNILFVFTFQAARQLEFFKGRSNSDLTTDSLADALALAQHHDAVTGTEKQHITNDYAMRLSIGYTQVSSQEYSYSYLMSSFGI